MPAQALGSMGQAAKRAAAARRWPRHGPGPSRTPAAGAAGMWPGGRNDAGACRLHGGQNQERCKAYHTAGAEKKKPLSGLTALRSMLVSHPAALGAGPPASHPEPAKKPAASPMSRQALPGFVVPRWPELVGHLSADKPPKGDSGFMPGGVRPPRLPKPARMPLKRLLMMGPRFSAELGQDRRVEFTPMAGEPSARALGEISPKQHWTSGSS